MSHVPRVSRSRPASRALLAAVTAAAALSAAQPAGAASSVATWELDERAGATGPMVDSSGHGMSGVVGSLVQRGAVVGGSTGYRFPSTSLHAGADRLVTVADRAGLDPGSATYTVTVRFRTGASHSNLVQKGQSNTAGGFFKVDLTKGVAYCTFKGSQGQAAVGSGRQLNDSATHVVTCRRDSTGVSMTVDGGAPRRTAGTTGTISNSDPLTLGGKRYCNQTTVGCDYYIGFLDRVALSVG